jgi:hypothetical protein
MYDKEELRRICGPTREDEEIFITWSFITRTLHELRVLPG